MLAGATGLVHNPRRFNTGMVMKHGIFGLAAVLFSLLAAGCATTPGAGLSAEESVAQRGRERWDSIFAKEYDISYEYLSPGYRAKLTRAEYMVRLLQQRIRWTAADFVEAQCEAETCMATWTVTWAYNVPLKGVGEYEGQKTLKERWILADGEWFFVPTL